MQKDITIYQNKSAICRTFGIGRQTMYRYEAGIREQMEHRVVTGYRCRKNM